jgi:hypothetical protein
MARAVTAGCPRGTALKVATFTVRATEKQSVRWKRAAEGEGFASVGSWAGGALDAFLEHRARAGRPIPLAWHLGAFKVRLLDGSEVTVPGRLSPPFAYFRGTAEGPVAGHRFSLVHLPTGKLIATLRAAGQARSLASELAPIYARDDTAGAAVVERHIREQA